MRSFGPVVGQPSAPVRQITICPAIFEARAVVKGLDDEHLPARPVGGQASVLVVPIVRRCLKSDPMADVAVMYGSWTDRRSAHDDPLRQYLR